MHCAHFLFLHFIVFKTENNYCWCIPSPKDVGSTGIESYFNSVIGTSCLLKNVTTPLDIKRSWLSRLAVPDSIIFEQDKGLKSAKMVLEVTDYGVITWPVLPRLHGGQRSYKLDLDKDARHEYVHITDLKHWMCQSIDIVPPASCKELTLEGVSCGIRAVVTSATVVGLLRFSAKHCFPGFRQHEFIELIKLLEIPVDTLPTTKGEATHVCLKYVLPLADDKEIADIMELGNNALKRLPFQSVLTQEGIDTLVDEVMPHDAKAELMGAAKEYKKYVESVKTAAVAKAKAKAKPAAGRKKRNVAKKICSSANLGGNICPSPPSVVSQTRPSGTRGSKPHIRVCRLQIKLPCVTKKAAMFLNVRPCSFA